MTMQRLLCLLIGSLFISLPTQAQIGRRLPSERKVVPDSVTGVPLTFLTSTAAGDKKMYPTHRQWTADGKWIVFRSERIRGHALAVNEATGDIVQVTGSEYSGTLCLAEKSMHLYYFHRPVLPQTEELADEADARRRRWRPRGPAQLMRVDLEKLFADSAANTLQDAEAYEMPCGTIPQEMGGGGNLAIDPAEDYAYFSVGREEARRHLDPNVEIQDTFGPRRMGAGPGGLARMNLATGQIDYIISVPFQVGHVQANRWKSGEIVFCWETGGKAPQRSWVVQADGTGLRPLYPEADYDWVTHEAVINADEVALAILCHRAPGTDDEWGMAGTPAHPSGVGIVNLRSREMRLVGQVPMGDTGTTIWHVHGSPDGRWAVADDFQYRLWIIDRTTGEMALLADLGHMTTAEDHIHPTFNADSTKISIQTAMLSEDRESLNICVVPVPPAWLARTYTTPHTP